MEKMRNDKTVFEYYVTPSIRTIIIEPSQMIASSPDTTDTDPEEQI